MPRVRHGTSAFELTPYQRHDAVDALTVLEGLDVTLKRAAQFYKTHANPPGGDKTVREVWEEIIDYKERIQKCRPRYVLSLKSKLSAFVQTFGERDIKGIGSEEIQDWLYSDQTIGETTRHGTYRYLSVLFGYAQGRRDRRTTTARPYRVDNPMPGVALPTVDEKPPAILSIQETKALLQSAYQHHGRFGLLPYVTLGLYCGIRTAELEQLDWRYVSLTKGIVTVHGRIAKKRRIRNVPIPENAQIWLALYVQDSGPIAPRNSMNRFNRFVKEAGWVKEAKRAGEKNRSTWPNNAMRHSFGSYFFAMTENAAATSARLGHRGDEVLFSHYRALCEKTDAEEYFSIMPPWHEKITVVHAEELKKDAST